MWAAIIQLVGNVIGGIFGNSRRQLDQYEAARQAELATAYGIEQRTATAYQASQAALLIVAILAIVFLYLMLRK